MRVKYRLLAFADRNCGKVGKGAGEFPCSARPVRVTLMAMSVIVPHVTAKKLLAPAWWTALFFILFIHTMRAPLSHDEYTHVTAGVLIKDNALYRDYAYPQMPYLPLIYGLFYKLSGTSSYLFWGRTFTAIFSDLTLILIYLISFRITKDRLFSWCLVILYTFSDIMLNVTSFSWNSVAPITLSLAAFYCYILYASEDRSSALGLGLSGLLNSLAIGVKLYYLATIPAYCLASVLYPASRPLKQRLLGILAPFLAGSALGLIGPCFYLLRDGDAFLFNNLTFFFINAEWCRMAGYGGGFTILSKLRQYAAVGGQLGNLALVFGFSHLLLTVADGLARQPRSLPVKEIFNQHNTLAFMLFTFTGCAIMTPRPVWFQYYAMPLAFLVILIVCLYRLLPVPLRPGARMVFLTLGLFQILYSGLPLVSSLARWGPEKPWETVRFHRVAREIAKAVGEGRGNHPIATLAPLYALEAGLPIYPELAAGPFLFRSGDLLSEAERKRMVTTSKNSLRRLLEARPPRAILVGYERGFEGPLIAYAEEKGYLKLKQSFNGGTLYLNQQLMENPNTAPPR